MAAPAMIEPDVDFVGIRIPPNTTVSFADKDRRSDSDSDSDENENADENDDDMPPPFIDGLSLIHATQVALGPNPAPGRHTVMAIRSTGVSGKGRAFPIGTLEAGKCEQFSVDLMWSMLRGGDSGGERFGGAAEGYGADIAFMHSGKSDVFITGYKTVTTSLLDEERGYSSGEDDDELSDEFSSDEEASGDEEAPLGVPLPRGHKGDRGGKDFSSSDDEDESDEESESEDEEEAVPRTPAGKRPLGGGGAQEESSDDDDDDGDEEEEPRSAAPPATKKVKQEGGGGGGSSFSSAVAAAESYAGALRAFLKAHGPTKLGALGAAVKKPAGLPPTKLTAFLTERRGEFSVDGEQRVALLRN